MTATAPNAVSSSGASKPRRRFWQFSLRTLMVAMLVLGVLFGLFAIRLERARRQAAAVATIRSVGGEVFYDYEKRLIARDPAVPSKVPKRLLDWLGPDFFHEVVEVALDSEAQPKSPEDASRCWAAVSELGKVEGIRASGAWINDQTIHAAARQSQLRRLFLRQGNISGNDLQPLAMLKNLETLALDKNLIGDDGAKWLSEFPRLETLGLNDTQFGDAGVTQIVANRSIESLYLSRTRVTDRGMIEVARLRRLKRLTLSKTKVSDVGIEHLAALPELRDLEISDTQVTGIGFNHSSHDSQLRGIMSQRCPVNDDGVRAIASLLRLEELSIADSTASVTGASLEHVHWPAKLREITLQGSGLTDGGLMRFVNSPKVFVINVRNTQVTAEGVQAFKQACPGVVVLGP